VAESEPKGKAKAKLKSKPKRGPGQYEDAGLTPEEDAELDRAFAAYVAELAAKRSDAAAAQIEERPG
jgi:hypothetical protein